MCRSENKYKKFEMYFFLFEELSINKVLVSSLN